MHLISQSGAAADLAADWLVIGLWQNEPLPPAYAELDKRLGGLLTQLLESKDILGKPNELTPILHCQGITAKRLLVVGLGERGKADRRSARLAAACAGRMLTEKQWNTLAVYVPEPLPGLSWQSSIEMVLLGFLSGAQGPGIRKSEPDRFHPAKVVIGVPSSAPAAEVDAATKEGGIIAGAVALTRELVNTPPCDLFPESFAERAAEVARTCGVECTIFDEHRLSQERMGALLGVAQGSERPPRFVVLRHHGQANAPVLGLVGKGVTFDSGGLSLKSSENMLDMKCDMAGAATVLGAVQAIATMNLPINVLAVMALVENMPSGKALKLGDVLHARNGKTIEIHNTDAEGRLILADALAYAVDQKVSHMVDLATLTGSCMVALGTEVTGLMSNNDPWAAKVQQAAAEAGELVWPLPMFPLYGEMIKSTVADMKNTGGSRWGGAITAAKLLQEFVGDVPWVHLDIAGPAWAESDSPTRAAGGTGVHVGTLVELAKKYPPA